MRNWWVIGIGLLIWGCKSTANVSGTDAYANYQETITSPLPEYPDFTTRLTASDESENSSEGTVNLQLEALQKRIYDKNKSEPYFGGFTVLAYSGLDRNLAFKTRDDLLALFPDLEPEMQYQQPRYLVKVGKYTYRIEAQRVFSLLKTQFPTARIIQDRFQRKEYLPPVTTDQNAQGQN